MKPENKDPDLGYDADGKIVGEKIIQPISEQAVMDELANSQLERPPVAPAPTYKAPVIATNPEAHLAADTISKDSTKQTKKLFSTTFLVIMSLIGIFVVSVVGFFFLAVFTMSANNYRF